MFASGLCPLIRVLQALSMPLYYVVVSESPCSVSSFCWYARPLLICFLVSTCQISLPHLQRNNAFDHSRITRSRTGMHKIVRDICY